ncbi:hypothetical protein SEA_ARTORIAS_5 [Gordonia phage Artorias]|nr:hypothetical protein SEA_ARTORIAS_5 [Gordonia phage Artorias]
MPLSTKVAQAFTRVGTEIKSVRSQLATTDAYAKRWEQEILVQAGVRKTGFGSAPMGIYLPRGVKIQGIRYQLETPTTSGATQGALWFNKEYNYNASGAQMNIAALNTGQTLTGLDITIAAGNRLSFEVTSIGSGTIGSGLYMALWGVYT